MFRKIHFYPNLGKKSLKWPQNRVFWIQLFVFDSLAFCGNNIWQNSGSQVMVQNAVFQSNCSILQNVISQEGRELWSWFLAYRSTSFLQVGTIILGVHDQVCWKYPKQEVCISLQYLHRNLGNEIHFLPADKHNLIVCVTTNAQITQNNKFALS